MPWLLIFSLWARQLKHEGDLNMSIILSIWTVVVFLLFLGIGIWAWSDKNKQTFDAASQIPFDDDEELVPLNGEDKHG